MNREDDEVLKQLCDFAETEARQQFDVFTLRYITEPDVVRGWINQSIVLWFLETKRKESGPVVIYSQPATEHIFKHLGTVFQKELREVEQKQLQTQS